MRILLLLAAISSFCNATESSPQFDVVFLVDGSETAKSYFAIFTSFIQNLMSPYNVGMNGVRIGLIVVAPNEYDQAPPVAVLSQITSVPSLIAYLNLMKEFASFDGMGQYLKNNLQLVSSENFMAPTNGYRADLDNHLLVYITSSTLFDADPVPVARTILKSMKYGIVTIGYGTDVDHEKMRKIAGGKPCSYSALNETELNSHIKSIRRHVLYADANKGKYCGNL